MKEVIAIDDQHYYLPQRKSYYCIDDHFQLLLILCIMK